MKKQNEAKLQALIVTITSLIGAIVIGVGTPFLLTIVHPVLGHLYFLGIFIWLGVLLFHKFHDDFKS